ncbi:uncharacterized protein A4U43_C03F23720 [Asparagus officinalis]|uniref:Uncharacterized protein n=1 Tax=Asparagus officinalis TaxID=4686 RepID=A0A5P1FCG6_ASPOF|nr:uncharacterized protein A4U43_C03F23720 [Asparagus officinalis]
MVGGLRWRSSPRRGLELAVGSQGEERAGESGRAPTMWGAEVEEERSKVKGRQATKSRERVDGSALRLFGGRLLYSQRLALSMGQFGWRSLSHLLLKLSQGLRRLVNYHFTPLDSSSGLLF